jgi:hypothetical protein
MKIILLGLALTFCLGTAFATTTDELTITSGAFTATFTDGGATGGGTCVGNGCSGFVKMVCAPTVGCISFYDTSFTDSNIDVSGTINGWTVNTQSESDSPTLGPGLDLGGTARCSGGANTPKCDANPLTISYSDINFAVPIPAHGFGTTYSGSDTGTGTTTDKAYSSNTNHLFQTTSLIGILGPFSGIGFNGTANGGPIAGIPPYSLTLDEIFTSTGSGAFFSIDANLLTASPEPAALVLFGTMLVFCAFKLRRRFVS